MRTYQFEGPNGGPPVLTLDGVYFTGEDGQRRLYKDALGKRYYDTWRFKAGTAVTVGAFTFFAIPKGGQTQGGNFATTFNKTAIDTNMQQAKQLPMGQLFKVE